MRPTDSHFERGADAYCEGGVDVSECPYPAGTHRWHEWRAGWLRALARDPFAFEDDDWILEEGRETARVEAAEACYESEDIRERWGALLPSVAELEAVCGPAEGWKSRCWEISGALLSSGLLDRLEAEAGPARVCYGAYCGYVSDDSPFAGRGGFVRHGWIEFEDGITVDPTRWVFTCSDPAIALGTIELYDLAHRRMRETLVGKRPAPDYEEGRPPLVWDVNDPDLTKLVDDLLGARSRVASHRRISVAQAMWLGGLPVGAFGEDAAAVYRAFERMGAIAFVPVDNRNYAAPPPPRPQAASPGLAPA